ncbi:MAG: redoxin domain-containing protein, partial [Anaerolineae bacterium]|nr:redoxin domain-containing protein [Anaerolineae bacterium]
MKYSRIWLFIALTVVGGVFIYFLPSMLDGTSPYEGTELDDQASDFELADQNGPLIRLSDFRGKVVVLTFMDSKCQDTCPITGVHFREVYRQLDQYEAQQVVFLGVNVNVEASA